MNRVRAFTNAVRDRRLLFLFQNVSLDFEAAFVKLTNLNFNATLAKLRLRKSFSFALRASGGSLASFFRRAEQLKLDQFKLQLDALRLKVISIISLLPFLFEKKKKQAIDIGNVCVKIGVKVGDFIELRSGEGGARVCARGWLVLACTDVKSTTLAAL